MNAPGAYLGIQPDTRSRSISPNPAPREGRRSLDGGSRSGSGSGGYNPLPPPPKESLYSTGNPEISRSSRSSSQSQSQSSSYQTQSRSQTQPTTPSHARTPSSSTPSNARTPSSSRTAATSTPLRSTTSASHQAHQRHRSREPEFEIEHFHGGVPPPPSPPPATKGGGSYTRMRIGYWNAHGDHLTPQGEILLPPPWAESPAELSGYPKVGKGFLDDIGRWKEGENAVQVRCDSKGRMKDRPFENYIIYRNVPTSSTSIEQRLAPVAPRR